MRKAKRWMVWFSLLFLMLSAGCWDRREIDDTGIVLGVGIDKAGTSSTEENSNQEDNETRRRTDRISMIHHFAVPKAFSQEGGGSAKTNYVNLINEGETIFEVIRELAARVERPPSYEHLQVLVISDEVARSINMNEIINFFIRNTETRRTIKVVIAKGKSRGVFETQPSIEQNPAVRLSKLIENTTKTMLIVPEVDLGDLSEALTAKSSFVIQLADHSKKDVTIAGTAVIKGKTAKMAGWLGGEETEGLNWLSGKGKAGIIQGSDPKTGKQMVYEIGTLKRKIKPHVKGGKISFTVEITTEGKLREDWVMPGNAFEQEFLSRAEKATETEIKRLVEKALNKTQKKLKVDLAAFGKNLSIHYPQVWKEVKKDWDEQFSELPIDVKVQVHIREYGTKATKVG